MKIVCKCLRALQVALFGCLVLAFTVALFAMETCYNWTAIAVTAIIGVAFALVSTLAYRVDPFEEY